jgi:hypothetical protein
MAKAKLSNGIKALISIAAVILAVIIAGGVYCVATDQNPSEAVHSVFSSNEEKLIGKWQSQDSPGLSAYVFKDDGTYDSYLSTVNFSGVYTVKGNKLTLKNPDTSKEIIYRYKITGKVLSLTLLEQDGREATEDEILKYDLVDELNQKSLSDLIGEIQSSKAAAESTTEAPDEED